MKKRYSKNTDLLPVTEPHLYELYHVAWAFSRGVVGRCIAIDDKNKTVILRKPKVKENFKNPVKWADLRYTRKMQDKIEGKKHYCQKPPDDGVEKKAK